MTCGVILKKGKNCHRDMWGVMGNSHGIGTAPMKVTQADGSSFVVMPEDIRKDGTLRKSAVCRLAAKSIAAA